MKLYCVVESRPEGPAIPLRFDEETPGLAVNMTCQNRLRFRFFADETSATNAMRAKLEEWNGNIAECNKNPKAIHMDPYVEDEFEVLGIDFPETPLTNSQREKTMTKAENDWFLRGGKRPEREPDTDTVTVEVAVCRNCGGCNLPDESECTHCGAPLTGEPSTEECCGAEDGEQDYGDEREFEVTMSRYRSTRQEARVTVKADCEESAMEKAEELAEDEGDEWNWKDVEGSEDIEDVEAEEAEELF